MKKQVLAVLAAAVLSAPVTMVVAASPKPVAQELPVMYVVPLASQQPLSIQAQGREARSRIHRDLLRDMSARLKQIEPGPLGAAPSAQVASSN